ncbi:MAG TPA: tRNA 2-thiouridine(34) synthase MnmA [Solirubrobacteraceae bacterium]|nr:tRNA 2-thiouridine(34) synthase MnmA [Solirubrobacteraceae bacterium]
MPPRGRGERVLVAMSGGVDSSVAAALLVEQGYDVIGATMKLFCYGDEPVPDRPCCSLDSINDARRVCETLGVPHYVLNLESAFGRDVVDDFVAEYARGRTPIPCVRCNTFTKFRDLLRKADAVDAAYVATGHYARVEDGELRRGADRRKDQTYFLWGIDRSVVRRMLLPVGNATKEQTRATARRLGLEVVAEKVESQDICFVPDGDHAKIIARRLGADTPSLARGPVLLSSGEVVGEHDGYARFTIGQRRGLPGGFREPMFVVEIRPAERAVVIGPREELLGRGVVAREVNWLVDAPPAVGDRVEVQIRHRAAPARAEVVRVGGGEIELALDEPVAAISPGQSLVLYEGERVLGGGIIEAARGARARTPLPVLAA